MNKLTSLCFAIVLIATSCKKEDVSTLETTPYTYHAQFQDYGEVTFTTRDGSDVEKATVEFGRGVILVEGQVATIKAVSMDRYVSLPEGNFRVFVSSPDGYVVEKCPYVWVDGQNVTHQDTLVGAELDRFTNWYAYDQDSVTASVESNGTYSTQVGTGSVTATLP